jgi:molecular chaperone DnaK (HSP70)
MASFAADGKEGAWIGIDLGTSNCACAVWDSTRGRPKLLQLRTIARPRKGKVGRIVPSCVLLQSKSIMGSNSTVGFPALELLENSSTSGDQDTAVLKACVTSIKRLVGATNGSSDQEFIQLLPFDVHEEDDGSLSLSVVPMENSATGTTIQVTPLEILTTILTSIRIASDHYLAKYTNKKKLQVPGSSTTTTNCAVGVPAHFGTKQRQLMKQALKLAGFTGHVSTITESTAASMAYGLFVSVPVEKHVLVLDMGGGTTDVTVAKLSPSSSGNAANDQSNNFSVVATDGDQRLGGDDMDEAILQLALQRFKKTLSSPLTRQERRQLLIRCRKCKESLCGTEEDKAVDSYKVVWNKENTTIITQADFNITMKPLIDRVQSLIRQMVPRVTGDKNKTSIDEVVLVGGATRVPAVQAMLKIEFPSIPDLCSSLSAEGAVAQGCAIQAAIKSGLVPLSELKSAMMLDALPHAIGVMLPGGDDDDDANYVPILQKDAQLPAMGYATFTLANIHQPGVTVVAVEDVGADVPLERIGEFNFLLRRLTKDQFQQMKGDGRTVDIGMTMATSGEFTVSIFDENDTEHLRKKQKFQQQNNGGGEIGFDEIEDDAVPTILIVACAFLFFVYVGVKLAFHDPGEGGDEII